MGSAVPVAGPFNGLRFIGRGGAIVDKTLSIDAITKPGW
jgi:hypothetical protein